MVSELTALPELQRLAALKYLDAVASGGSPSDPAWSGTGAGSEVAILKAIYAQLVTANATLATIATNTTPAP